MVGSCVSWTTIEETAKLETEEEKTARKGPRRTWIQQTEERLMQEAVDAQAFKAQLEEEAGGSRR